MPETASNETILLKFAKYILEVLLNSSNSAVLGELDWYVDIWGKSHGVWIVGVVLQLH